MPNLKDKFTANITHELKTPLTSIIGFIELLKKDGERDKQTRDYFYDVIDSEAQRLLRLIDDVLLLSQVENSKDSILTQQCNIKKEISDVIKILIPLSNAKNVTFSTDIEDELIINASSTRLHQLFSNLIGNAIKYNVQNGNIFINAHRDKDNVVISIKDTGIGIDSMHINKIFDRFYRINTANTSEIPGNGLGLSIVKDIVTLYKGDIKVNSVLGKGSEFIITFPHTNKTSL